MPPVIHSRALRRVDPKDPRPHPLAEIICGRAAQVVAPEVLKWANGRVPDFLDDSRATFVVTVALAKAGADAFRAGTVLRETFFFPVDMALVKLLDQAIDLLPSCLKVVTGEWAMRTGIRFPGKAGDLIEYYDENDCQVAGKVHTVDAAHAMAVVIREIDDEAVKVCAEQVVANVTQARYEPESPELGIQYEDAPALIAAQPERVRKPTLTVVAGAGFDDDPPPRVA